MRKKWQNVTIPPHQGKLYRKTWKQFEMLFRQAWLDVPDVTDREAYQTLISKLPEFVMKYVRDAKRDLQKTPVLFMKALPGYTQAEMAESIKIMTGKHPKKVEIGVGGTYMIQVENSSMSEKLLAFSGKKIAESTQEFEIQPVEQVVTLNELFQLVYDQLPEESENDRNQNQNPKGQSGTHNVEAKTKQKPEFDMSGTDRKNSGGKSSSAPQVFQTALGVQVVQVIRSSPPPAGGSCVDSGLPAPRGCTCASPLIHWGGGVHVCPSSCWRARSEFFTLCVSQCGSPISPPKRLESECWLLLPIREGGVESK